MQGKAAAEKVQVAFLPIDTSSYQLGPSLPTAQQPLAWQQAQDASRTSYSGGTPLNRDDIVAAIVTDKWHEELVQSSRLWRQVIRPWHPLCHLPHHVLLTCHVIMQGACWQSGLGWRASFRQYAFWVCET